MGLLDRNKRKPAVPVPAAPAPAMQPARASEPDGDGLRDMLIAAASAGDAKLLATLATANRQAILDHFGIWQRVPEAIRENGGAMQRYARTLIQIAELFRDKFGDPSLATLLAGPSPDNFQANWERAMQQSEELLKELKYADARDLLEQVVAALGDVPTTGEIPFHAVTHGRLAHTLFSMGEIEPAVEHMQKALELSEARADDQGISAALRGLFEFRRYQGRFAEAADMNDRLSAHFAKLGDAAEAEALAKQSASVRAGEPLCRVMFFVDDKPVEVDEVPQLATTRLRYGYVRNRPPLPLAEALMHRGMQLGGAGKFDEALATFREAGRIDPFDPSPPYQAAITLMHLQKFADAVVEYDRAEALAPGWFNVRAERWLAAETAADRLPPPVFFIVRTEEMPTEAMGWEQKLTLVDQAIAQAGELPPLMLYRARCLMRLQRIPEAEPALRKGLAAAQEPDIRTRLLVDLQMVLADPDEKKRLLEEAITLNGNLAAVAVAKIMLRQVPTLQS